MRSRDTSRDVTLRNVTLIVLCREPLAGHTKTRLIPRLGAANGAELTSAFLDALAKCRALAPRRIVIAPIRHRSPPHLLAPASRCCGVPLL
jgi:hypothetical protein